MSENKVVDIILHCQKQIKKERLPEEKLLHYLGRLSRLRITVQDLADTGIGRTVNSLSRNEGQIGAAADTLVRRWKQMVSEQQTQAEQRRQSEEESDSNSGSSEDEEDEEEENPPPDSQPYQIEDPQDQQVDPEDQPYISIPDVPPAPLPSSHEKQRGGYPQDEEDEDEDLNDDIDDPYMENGFMTMANVHSDPEIDEEEEDFDKGSDSDNSDRLEIDDDEDQPQLSPPPRSSSQIDVKPDIYSNIKREKMDIPIPTSSKDHKSSSKSNNTEHHKSQENGEKKHHHHSGTSSSSTLSPLKSHHHLSSSKEKHRHSSKDRSSKHGDPQQSSSSSSSSSHHHKSHSSSSSKSDKSKEPKSESNHHKEKDKQHDKHHHRSKETSGSSSHRDRSEKDSVGGVKCEKERSIPSKDKDTPSKKSESSSDRDHHHRSSTISGSSSRDKDIKSKTRDIASSSSSTSHSPKKSSLENSGNIKKEKESTSSLSSAIPTHEDRKRKDHSVEMASTSSNKKSKLVLKEEIDSTSGINFADVLGCLDVSGTSTTKHVTSSKKDKKVEPSSSSADKEQHHHHRKSHHHQGSSSKSSSSSKHSSSSSKDAGSSSSSKKHERDSRKAILPQSKIESVIQPVVNISPNYKPMSSTIAKLAIKPGAGSSSIYNGNGIASVPPSSQMPMISHADLSDLGTVDYYDNPGGVTSDMSHEDAISTMLSSRPARSKVYSGVKTGRKGEVTSLFDQCMQVIKDNIGDLGYTGGIPYDILKPAIERANPQQLMSIEQQNEYLIGETDELWAFHCKRDFRGRCPVETESWRELYERCSEDQKLKFERIKKQMKRNIAKAEPVRTTKLAYVETTLGPKFNRQKAQTIKNGMKSLKIKEEKGPSRGVSSSASAAFNNPKRSGDAASVVYQEAAVIIAQESRAGHAPAPSQSREGREAASAAKMKPRKAPLMQKTMKLIKTLQRR